MGRRARLGGVLASILICSMGAAAAATPRCFVVAGGLHADIYTLPDCSRGIFMCAHVALTGDLAPRSEFTFTSLGHGNVMDPAAFTYTGDAVVSAENGHMATDDSGRFELSARGPSPFHTVGTITGGDGDYTGASGVIQVTGLLDFTTRTGDGSYVGGVCVPS